MEETMKAPRSHRSSSPAALSNQLESSRTGRECGGNDLKPRSPLPGRGASYTDQCNEVSDISKTALDANDKDSVAKMRYVAKFLQSIPDRERDYMSDPEAMYALDRYAKSNWKNLGRDQLLTAGFSPKKRELSSPKNGGYASDGYSSEGTREESASQELANDYRTGRSPNRDGLNFGTNDSLDDPRDAKRPFCHNYLKSGGYELDNNQGHESKYQSTVGSGTEVSAEDNPLAAMLQKFAVGDRFSASPLKNVVPISASLYAGKGLPKKRRYRNDVFFPSAISYGMPSVNSSGGIMTQSGKERGADHPDVFICHICSFVATSNEDFKLHMRIHYDYQCPQCTYSSRTEGRLKHHIKYFHEAVNLDAGDEGIQDSRHFQKTNQPKKFRCRQCHFISYSREEHWNHISVHIKKEKQLKCIHCPFVTEFKHHLEYHIRNHNNSKPYKCSKCNYTCVNKSMLNSHMKSHTNVYQFRCASCKYATKYSHSLKLHLINKRHLPAVVLNPDGSLPTDGSGSFDLISKRGPPRGPCRPRKSKMAADDTSPPALLPIFPTSTSSIMSFGHASEFPWVPAGQNNGKPLNGVAIPGINALPLPINGTLRTSTVAPPEQSLGYPLSILSQLSSSVASSSVVGYPVVSTSVMALVPCGFCPATFSSLTLLADHVRLEHAVRLGGCGVKLETNSPTEEPTSGNIHPCSERGGEIEVKRNSVSAEIPLDLSSKNSDGAKRTALKRSAVYDDEDSSRTASPSSAAISRKRSRKGKACKLDELSLKLQDHWKEEDAVLEGSESSSVDDECHFSLRGGSGVVRKESKNLETERKFFEVGCGTSSPLDDNGAWKKELTQYSDADSSDQHHDSVRKSVTSGESSKPAKFSDKEPGSDGNTDGSVTSRANPGTPARQTPDNGYYTCNHCDMGFRDNVTHFLHMGYHTYDDPFKCNKCGHRSTNAIDFFVHMARVAHTQ